ncbi:hypothetical protein [Streptomyces griseocarneus]|uniref:hypothetical protein n=1 Tax=Streptomyces griseocarneus TaxID=51201 RepID=UPI00167D298C|nr:hypothetical protein [Streptomyces griseocarneus]MBZ6476738.1 hypothetical protein [Streptomyces griseocarneus]GHG80634.1 hypothetical protein GCM10018779_62370 [Streptomyces griseocarneus]
MRIAKAAITGCAAALLALVRTSAAGADVRFTTGKGSILATSVAVRARIARALTDARVYVATGTTSPSRTAVCP